MGKHIKEEISDPPAKNVIKSNPIWPIHSISAVKNNYPCIEYSAAKIEMDTMIVHHEILIESPIFQGQGRIRIFFKNKGYLYWSTQGFSINIKNNDEKTIFKGECK